MIDRMKLIRICFFVREVNGEGFLYVKTIFLQNIVVTAIRFPPLGLQDFFEYRTFPHHPVFPFMIMPGYRRPTDIRGLGRGDRRSWEVESNHP